MVSWSLLKKCGALLCVHKDLWWFISGKNPKNRQNKCLIRVWIAFLYQEVLKTGLSHKGVLVITVRPDLQSLGAKHGRFNKSIINLMPQLYTIMGTPWYIWNSITNQHQNGNSFNENKCSPTMCPCWTWLKYTKTVSLAPSVYQNLPSGVGCRSKRSKNSHGSRVLPLHLRSISFSSLKCCIDTCSINVFHPATKLPKTSPMAASRTV